MRFLTAIFLSIFLAACSPPALEPTANVNAILTVTAPKKSADTSSSTTPSRSIALVAHRGGAGLKPENTLASFSNGIALGADFIEMDVHLTQDGIPVIIHDPTIDRTTDSKGAVNSLALADLQKFNAAAKFSGATEKQIVPTLAQVLDLAKPSNVKLEIEIKVDANGKRYPDIEQKVLSEIAARGMNDRVKVMAFEFETLKQIRALDPRIITVALMTTDYFRAHALTAPAAIIDEVAPFANSIGIDKNFLNAELVQQAHVRQMTAGVWTVDTTSDMQKFIAMGVDEITSNQPEVLKRVLGK